MSTTATVLVAVMLSGLLGTTLHAQQPAGQSTAPANPMAASAAVHDANSVADAMAPANPRNEVEEHLYKRFVCLCGSCGKEPIGTCTCSYAAGVRKEVGVLVDQGKSEDAIVQHFIEKYGSQELLGAPLDQGVGRFAWLFPYMVGAGTIVVVGFAAMRWTRRTDGDEGDSKEAADPALDQRLDDELRNLD